MISIKSYAKINLVLNCYERMEDGYHSLDSIMLPISLHDSLIVSKQHSSDNYITIDDYSHGVVRFNIASTTLEKLQAKYNVSDRYRIFIHKVIPMQAGLGGGSSNAAYTIKAFEKMSKISIPFDEQIELAKTLGADVPFFLTCKPARAKGIGEKLTPITVKNNYWVLVVKPSQGLSTKEVFEEADKMEMSIGNIDNVVKALEEGDDELLANNINNSLEAPAIKLLPEIQVIKHKLYNAGLKIVSMTGSGSAVFAMSTDKSLLKKAMRLLEDDYRVELAKVLK